VGESDQRNRRRKDISVALREWFGGRVRYSGGENGQQIQRVRTVNRWNSRPIGCDEQLCDEYVVPRCRDHDGDHAQSLREWSFGRNSGREFNEHTVRIVIGGYGYDQRIERGPNF
jgi:hypothetical protein